MAMSIDPIEDDDSKPQRLGIVAFSPGSPENPGLTNLIEVIRALTPQLYVVTGNYHSASISPSNVYIYNIANNMPFDSTINKIYMSLVFQLSCAYQLFAIRDKIDTVFFHIGTTLILPILILKLMRKKTIIILTGSAANSAKQTYESIFGRYFLYYIIKFLEILNMSLSDRIVAFSPNMILNLQLCKFNYKISTEGSPFIDLNIFRNDVEYASRETIIGYVGRLSQEKGILNLIDAAPEICRIYRDAQFLIIGDGNLFSEIKNKINEINLSKNVKILGWVDNNELPKYLNTFRLFVVPSYTEAGPVTALEAMACGTPVVAAPVGILPDIIRNRENGFMMENNSPEVIAEMVIRALGNPELNVISDNARKSMEESFSLDCAIKRYKDILEKI